MLGFFLILCVFFAIVYMAIYFLFYDYFESGFSKIVLIGVYLFFAWLSYISLQNIEEEKSNGLIDGYYLEANEAKLSNFEMNEKVKDNYLIIDEVGAFKEFYILSVNSDEEYKIGYKNESEDLIWVDLDDINFKVKITDDESKVNKIYRVNNSIITEKANNKNVYKIASFNYEIYINKDSLSGSTSKKSCGKGCSRDVQNEIIN